jgi:ABC-type bacteriocin/lantibiotic exporter with double-glycine peptidase domain
MTRSSDATAAKMVELDRVSVRFERTATPSVDQVTLSIARGTFVSLVGESGSGKTSLLKTINGLVIPSAGTVRVASA